MTGGGNSKLFREFGNFIGNRDTWKFFRETRDNSGTLQEKSGHRRNFFFMYCKNSGGWSKFPGRLRLTPSIAQTAFVRVVTPRLIDKASLHDDDSRGWRGDSLRSRVHTCGDIRMETHTITDSPAWFSRGSQWLVCMSSADWRQWLYYNQVRSRWIDLHAKLLVSTKNCNKNLQIAPIWSELQKLSQDISFHLFYLEH